MFAENNMRCGDEKNMTTRSKKFGCNDETDNNVYINIALMNSKLVGTLQVVIFDHF